MAKVDRRLHVLRLVHTINETGSPYNQFSLAAADRQDVTICSYFRPEIAAAEGIKLFAGDGTLPGFFRALRGALVEKKYDVIHTHTPHVGFFLVAASFANPGLLRSAVHTVHSSYSHYDLRHRLMLVWVFCLFRRIVSCGRASYASFPWFLRWLGGLRFRVVQNGVDLDRIDRVVDWRRGRRPPFSILVVGRLMDLKNPASVLRAFEAGHDSGSRLVFIGKGPLRPALAEMVKGLDLNDQVEFTGLVPREEVYRRLAAADLFVSASSVEGLPVAVLEAMACGCPVILSDIPSHREIAGEADFVPLVRCDDVDGFAREIRRIRNLSPAERAELGARCRRHAQDRFSLAAMHRGYERTYREVARGRVGRGGP